MLRAQIGGSVEFSGAKLIGETDALTLDKVSIGGNLLLNGKLQCTGTIRLLNCHIRGDLNFMGAEICSVRCDNMNLSGDLMWLGVKKTLKTYLDLRRARVKTFRDDEASWSEDCELKLDNFVYDNLILHRTPSQEQLDKGTRSDELPLEVDQRIAWLKLQAPANLLQPQPWVQLTRCLESTNDKTGAKKVLYKFRCLQAEDKSWWLKRRAKIAFAWLE
jgi:hypothetical protein